MNGEWFVVQRAPCGVCSGDGIVWRGDQAKNCPHCEGVGHIATEMPLVVALRDLAIDVDTIQQAQRQAQRAAIDVDTIQQARRQAQRAAIDVDTIQQAQRQAQRAAINVDTIQQARRQAQRAADVASMLANGILPD